MINKKNALNLIKFILILGTSTSAYSSEGCKYFEELIEAKSEVLVTDARLKRAEKKKLEDHHEYPRAYAIAELQREMNHQLYLRRAEAEEKKPSDRNWLNITFTSLFSTSDQDETSVEDAASNTTIISTNNYKHSLKCANSRENFTWPNEIDWVVIPHLLNAIKIISDNDEVCRVQAALYQYRFWRDPYVKHTDKEGGKSGFKGNIGFKIRNELMKETTSECKDIIKNQLRNPIADRTENYARNSTYVAYNDPETSRMETIRLETIKFRLVPIKKKEDGEFKLHPVSESKRLSFSIFEESKSSDKTSSNLVVEYKHNNGLFKVEICEGEISKYFTKKSEDKFSLDCEVNNNKIYIMKNKMIIYSDIKFPDESPSRANITLKIDSKNDMLLSALTKKTKMGFYINGDKCKSDGFVEEQVKSDYRAFYYFPVISNEKTYLEYFHSHNAFKEIIQKNIYNCLN